MYGKLRDVLDHKGSEVFEIDAATTVREAVDTMNEKGVGALVVTHQDRIAGIFTERDVLRRVVAAHKNPKETTVGDVMTRELLTVRPNVMVEDAMAILTSKRCRHLPVIEEGKLEGLVSIGDLTEWVNHGRKVHIQELVDYISNTYPR